MQNIQQMMKKAQELQSKVTELQDSAKNMMVQGKAGAGLVTVEVTCAGEAKKVCIDPSLMKIEEKEMLEDLIAAAYNNAKAEADSKMSDEMAKITAASGLPAGMKLPF